VEGQRGGRPQRREGEGRAEDEQGGANVHGHTLEPPA
jgi:hypothetical protein